MARSEEHGGKKWRRSIYLPLGPTPYPSSPGCFFLLIFLCTYHVQVLRVRDSRNYSRKKRVFTVYLLPLLPLSSNIIRVIVRNVPVWEIYISHLSHDRLRAAEYFCLEWSLKSKWKQSQKINVTIFFLSFTARFKICPAGEICVTWAEPLKCTTRNLFSSRVFLLNLLPVYKICLLKNIKIFHSRCNLRYLLLISPYSLGLRDLREQCSAVHSTYSLNVSRSDTGFGQVRLW